MRVENYRFLKLFGTVANLLGFRYGSRIVARVTAVNQHLLILVNSQHTKRQCSALTMQQRPTTSWNTPKMSTMCCHADQTIKLGFIVMRLLQFRISLLAVHLNPPPRPKA